MVIDGTREPIHLTPTLIAALSKRDTGIGFDQCLLIEPSNNDSIDFFYRIFNANGQEVGQCGNGARCIARFAKHYGLTSNTTLRVATKTTALVLTINPDDTVTVTMEPPQSNPASIPLHAESQQILYTLPLKNGDTCEVHAIAVGNPHALIVVSNVAQAPVQSLGQLISEHSFFPEETNVEFMQIDTPNHVQLRVYERGCGETRACGSGAVAAVAMGRLYHQLAEHVTVNLPGGKLWVDWPSLDGPIFLTGPATFVYEGQLL